MRIEIVPAILRTTFEALAEDWERMRAAADHIQIDVTDGIFAGGGSWRDIRRLKQLTGSEKIELHLMVHTPAHYVDDVIDLNPARCVFHVEAFTGTGDLAFVYEKLRAATQAELGLALNPDSPAQRLEEHLGLVDYVLFMGYAPGWANQPIEPRVFRTVGSFREKHPEMPIAVDGHVNQDTVAAYVQAGATILCANTAIFGQGDPVENLRQLQLLAEAAANDRTTP